MADEASDIWIRMIDSRSALLAIDGNPDQHVEKCAQTTPGDPSPVWMTQLEVSAYVTQVEIVTAIDCCGNCIIKGVPRILIRGFLKK